MICLFAAPQVQLSFWPIFSKISYRVHAKIMFDRNLWSSGLSHQDLHGIPHSHTIWVAPRKTHCFAKWRHTANAWRVSAADLHPRASLQPSGPSLRSDRICSGRARRSTSDNRPIEQKVGNRSQRAVSRSDGTMHQSAYRLSPDDYLSDSGSSSAWKVGPRSASPGHLKRSYIKLSIGLLNVTFRCTLPPAGLGRNPGGQRGFGHFDFWTSENTSAIYRLQR